MDSPTVTIICLTYNHAPYIRDALEGFLAQRTSFPFEVLVHDDASSDGTAEIVKEYGEKYPDKIHPVLQSVNQRSQGRIIPQEFLFPLVLGEFVALCEGDDYWSNPLKLEKQVHALKVHPECDLCTHTVLKIKDGRITGAVCPSLKERTIPFEKVIEGGGAFVGTSSILCRREAYLRVPPFRQYLFDDYSLQILSSFRGGMHFLPEAMGVYRRGVPGSWSERHKGKRKIVAKERDIGMLRLLDGETDGKYHSVIERRIKYYGYDIIRAGGRYHKLFSLKEIPFYLKRILQGAGRALRSVATCIPALFRGEAAFSPLHHLDTNER